VESKTYVENKEFKRGAAPLIKISPSQTTDKKA
jgi:hypothetical protein